jgi:hypothetical protein
MVAVVSLVGDDGMRRWKVLVALAGLAVLIAAGVVGLWSYQWPNAVTRETYDRIEIGMSLPALETLLGPHRDESQILMEDISNTGVWVIEGDLKTPEYVDDPGWPGEFHFWLWRGQQGVIMVRHDAQARAIGKVWVPRLGVIERLKRQWRRGFP